MANSSNMPDFFNPVTFWTDLGFNALNTAVSSAQDMTEGVDRLARAGAAQEVTEPATTAKNSVMDRSSSTAPDYGLGIALRMQRVSFDLMTQGWQQWFTMLGTLASLGAGHGFRETIERQNPWLNSMRKTLVSQAEAAVPRSAGTDSSREHRGNGRERHAARGAAERAVASVQPKPRSRRTRSKASTRSRG